MSRADGPRRERRQRPPRRHRHGVFRPTVGGWLMLLATAAAWAAALWLRSRGPVAVAVALSTVCVLAVMCSLVQFVALRMVCPANRRRKHRRRRRGNDAASSTASGVSVWTMLAPPAVRLVADVDRIDEDGAVVERLQGAVSSALDDDVRLPRRRGLFRLVAHEASWRGLFGLVFVRTVLRSDTEFGVVPDGTGRPAPTEARPGSKTGMSDERSGQIREYMPGDTPHAIAWRHSARTGELMTKLTERDERRTVLVVVDPATGAGDDGGSGAAHPTTAHDSSPLDHAVAAVFAAFPELASPRDPHAAGRQPTRIVVTDGVHVAATPAGRLRLLAALEPSATSASRREIDGVVAALKRRLGGTVTVWRPSGADIAAQRAAGTPPLLTVRFRASGIASVRRAARKTASASSSPTAASALALPCCAPVSVIRHVLSSVALFAGIVLPAATLTNVVRPGLWTVYAVAGLAWIAVMTAVPLRRHPLSDNVRALVTTVVLVLGAAGFAAVAVHADVLSTTTMSASSPASRALAGMPWYRLAVADFRLGVAALGRQLPPVTVSGAGADLVVLVAVLFVLVLVRWILAFGRRAVPVLVTVAGALFGVAASFVPVTPSWTVLAGWAASLVVALVTTATPVAGAVRRESFRRVPSSSAPGRSGESLPVSTTGAARRAAVAVARTVPLPLVATLAAAGLTVSLTPSAITLAESFPLTANPTTGLLSSNTVNPLVDLRRTLAEGSSSTMLSYDWSTTLYLRMTTLSDFDGDVWSFDESLAGTADLYGSAAFASGQSTDESDGDGDATVNPVVWYVTELVDASAWRTVSSSYAADQSSPLTVDDSTSRAAIDTLDDLVVEPELFITNLESRFLPVAGFPLTLQSGARRTGDAATGTDTGDQGYLDATTGETDDADVDITVESTGESQSTVENRTSANGNDLDGWKSHTDGTVYNTDSTTFRGQRYVANGVYLTPITSTDSFGQLEQLADIADYLKTAPGFSTLGYWDTLDDNEAAVRAEYATLPAGESLPSQVTDVVDAARKAGVDTDAVAAGSRSAELAALKYLVGYFTDPDSGFVYSLSTPDGNAHDNMATIASFLDRKSGYCQHYASALAILGRAMGLPTRMVLGYIAKPAPQQGEGRQSATGFLKEYDVASDQLHAWTEVYVSGVGWVPFDVTPATTADGNDSSASASASASATDEPTDPDATVTEDETDAADSQAAADVDDTADADGGTARDMSWTTALADWMRDHPAGACVCAAGLLVVVAALVTGIVFGVRRMRRRHRIDGWSAAMALAAGDGAGDDDRNAGWLAAWSAILDRAREAGVQLPASADDLQMARLISATPEFPVPPAIVTKVAGQASAAAFGGRCEPLPAAWIDEILPKRR
ncbi:transglutaminaseTgpA domain-containing protein [Bifidobacterium choloepi]|uniref:DUF58 domain-containing protein n=1 Tax=Bifidobacterium choloepi TaxID=2614131 RepID=A0A6I5MYI1_9BIFI|nr:transglutaminaseTgpA domain-containing protein [Bifidobacterium choloepi]NEG69256.1 DUF58 domain-containing protein [Bifidobacterium choloepi]